MFARFRSVQTDFRSMRKAACIARMAQPCGTEMAMTSTPLHLSTVTPRCCQVMPHRMPVSMDGTPGADGARRRYVLPVPANLRTAREAVAWTYGMSDRQYAGLQLRT
jgi:Domain of unknown function (DUF6745)